MKPYGVLVWVTALSLGSPRLTTAASTAARTIRVTEVDGNTAVTIAAARRPTFTTWKLEQPSRVVVDIAGVRLGDADLAFDAGTFAVGAVSASTSQDDGAPRTRVVLTLRRPADYRVQVDSDTLVVRVIPHERPPAVAERVGAEEARRTAEEAQRRKDQETAELASRAAAQAAAADGARLLTDRQQVESMRRDLVSRGEALGRAEAEIKKVQIDVEAARQRAAAVERQAEAARLREEARGNAVRDAAAQVELRRRMVEAKVAAQEEQRFKLEETGRLVAKREVALQSAVADLAARAQAATVAATRRDEAQRAGVSAQERALAAREQSFAEQQRKAAAAANERSRRELDEAVAERRREQVRTIDLAKERAGEEQRWKVAVSTQRAEDARLAVAEQTRRQQEASLVLAQVSTRQVPAVRAPSITLRVPSRVQRIEFVDEPARSSVIIDLDEMSTFTVERVGVRRLTLHLLHADLPRGLERSRDATEYLGPVRLISSYRDPVDRSAVRVDVELAEDVANTVRQDGNRLYWDFKKSAPGAWLAPGPGDSAPRLRARSLEWRSVFVAPTKVAALRLAPLALSSAQTQTIGTQAGALRPMVGKKRYVGRRIDLDLKGADIHNILRLLSDVGGVNIVTSDDVRGEVTIKMKDVPWDQALDVVLRAKLLGQVREGNLIRVAPLQVLEKELEQEIARQKQITDVLPTETRLIGVSYAEAKLLQDRCKDLLSQRGKISVDDRTNTLIVSDVAKNLALIEELVRNLDTQTSMIIIEARIVEARSTFVRQLGIQWGGTGFADADHGNPTGLAFPFNVGVGGGATDSTTPLNGLVPSPRSGTGSASPNFAVNLPVAAGTGSGGAIGLTLGSVAGAFNLNLRLSALENSGQVRIISSPRVSTLDNHEAVIEQGVSIPIAVVSAQGAQTVFVDANLSLKVKPHVTNEGTVTMDVDVTRNEPDFVNTGARGDPTILKKSVKNKLLVRDGDTAVIGGIYQRNSGLNYAKVPFFADIPVIGVLFRNRRENDDRTEFLVFLTPRIANRARALGQ